ncbi:MAG: hypothetical protein ACTSRU_07285 [Candidatus Hodarchaeales archaeon]
MEKSNLTDFWDKTSIPPVFLKRDVLWLKQVKVEFERLQINNKGLQEHSAELTIEIGELQQEIRKWLKIAELAEMLSKDMTEGIKTIQKLEAIKPYIEHDFWGFYKAMIDTYKKHKPVKGDTWKEMSWGYLADNLTKQLEDMTERDDEDFYANIGNYSAMMWCHENILGVQ